MYTKNSVPRNHSEFGGGPGMIDPEVRKDRAVDGPASEYQLWEVYATNPAPPDVARGDTPEARTTRAAEIAIENDPLRAVIERP